MNSGITHLLVAASKWELSGTKFRRNRLVEYLLKQEETDKVIWVYPVKATPREPKSYMKALNQLGTNHISSDNKLISIGLPDLLPGRQQRLRNLFLWSFHKNIKQQVDEHQGKIVLWFTIPGYSFLTGLIDWDAIIYDCSDFWIASAGGNKSVFSHIARYGRNKAEQAIVNSSNVIFATSDYLAAQIVKRFNRKPIVIENGVDYKVFSEQSKNENLYLEGVPKPRFGFVGGMKPKINYNLLAEMASKKSDWSIVLIGPGPEWKNDEFDKLLGYKNVYWLGAVEPNEVPKYMAGLDVGLLPYKEIEYNKGVFPLKLFEYLATGLPAIGCGLPSTVRYVQYGVYKHVDPSKFISACEEVLFWEKDGYFVEDRRNLAKEFSWDKIFKRMYEIILQQTC